MPAITNAIRKPTLRQFLGLTFGPLCVATALAVFLVPNNVVAGGVSGIATILSHFTGLPVGVLMICCNEMCIRDRIKSQVLYRLS